MLLLHIIKPWPQNETQTLIRVNEERDTKLVEFLVGKFPKGPYPQDAERTILVRQTRAKIVFTMLEGISQEKLYTVTMGVGSLFF